MEVRGIIFAVVVVVAFLGHIAGAQQTAAYAQQSTMNLENGKYQITVTTSQTLAVTELVHKYAGENILKDPSAMTLFSIQIGDAVYTPEDFHIDGFLREDDAITFQLVPVKKTVPVSASVIFKTTEWDELSIGLKVTNISNEDIPELVTTFPVIGGVRFGETSSDEMVFIPVSHGMLANENEGTYTYGGACFWQLSDLYNDEKGYGFYCRIDDSTGDYKRLAIKKSDDENVFSFAAQYCEKPIKYDATLNYPPVILGFHEDNWRRALDNYMKWVDTWYQRRPTPEWFKRSFLIRADSLHSWPGVWPYEFKNESSLMYDEKNKQYRIAERYYEMLPTVQFDIIHYWRWWDGAWTWKRHGDYYFPPLRGGEDAFRNAITKLQQEGVHFTLYFEGYLLGKETYAGHKYGKEWSFMNKDGSFFGDYGDDYWKCCVSVPEWQDFLVEATTRIARQTGIKGIYIDSIGAHSARLCYNPAHNHPNPGTFDQGMAEMFQKLRASLDTVDPEIVLYSEAIHNDYMSQYMDGALGPWRGWQWPIDNDAQYQVPPVNLFRFYFPDVKLFAIPSFVNTARLLMVELFNGNGMFVQYIPDEATPYEDKESWKNHYGEGELTPDIFPNALKAIKKISEVYHENIYPFVSDDVYPLVPTLIKGVYANRFSSTGKTIYTFYNTTKKDYAGEYIIELNAKPGYHYVDILRKRPLYYEVVDDKVKIAININADEVAGIAELPEMLRFDKNDSSITLLKPLSGSMIVTSLVNEDGNIEKEVHTIGENGTYIIKLIDEDDQLLDALVIER